MAQTNQVESAGAGAGTTRPSGTTTLAPGQDTDRQRRESWQGYSSPEETASHAITEIKAKYGPSGTNELKDREFGTLIYTSNGKFYYAPIMQGPMPSKTDAYATVNVDAAQKYIPDAQVKLDFHTHPTMDWQTGKRAPGPLAASGGDYLKSWTDNRPGIVWSQGERRAILYRTDDFYSRQYNTYFSVDR